MDFLLLALAILLLLLGYIGCVAPVLPGPPLGFAGLLLIHFTRWGPLEPMVLVWMGVLALVVTLLDYLLPSLVTKRLGGTNRGAWGAMIGLLVGMLVPPVGIIVGLIAGAFLGELSHRRGSAQAIRSALASLLGFMLGTGLKLIAMGLITYQLVVALVG